MYQNLRLRTSFQSCSRWLALCLLLVLGEATAVGQMLSAQKSLDRAGLTSLWFTSAELGAGGKIIDWALNIDQTKSTTYIRIEAGLHREVISQNDLNAFGKPLNLDGLVEHAEFRKEVLEAELKSQNRTDKVELKQYTLPKSTIYVLGSNSRITSIDADNGRQNWSVGFGSLNQPSIGIHADDQHVVAVNGSSVYCFEVETGKQMWSHSCRYAVEAPPVVTQGKVYVPLVDGRLEIFEVANAGFGSFALVGKGLPTSRPLVTSQVVAWPTDVGHLNFTGLSKRLEKSLIYRLKADGRIGSTPTYRDNLVFTASEDGFVYAIKEDVGALQWQSSVGTPVSQAPFIFGSRVYVVSDDQRMFCLDAHSGEMQWDEPIGGMGIYLGASRDRIYLTDGSITLLVVDPVTGNVVSRAEIGNVNAVLSNNYTDRLYVANNAGIIHCIHEIGHPVPYFHPNKLEAPKGEDPFAEGADVVAGNPFGEDEGEAAESDAKNPFGEDSTEMSESENLAAESGTEKNPFSFEDDEAGKGSAEPKENEDPFSEGGSASGDGDDQPANDPEPETAAPKQVKVVVWKNVEPIFAKNCSKCHNATESKGGFDVSSYASVMSQGEDLITPGEGETSHLYKILKHEEEPAMPPEGKKITSGSLKKIKDWINDGALENQPAPNEGGDSDPDDQDPFGS